MSDQPAEFDSSALAIERLNRIRFGSRLLHDSLESLWDEIPEPPSKRALAVRGFSNIVRQHVFAQFLLIGNELDVTATALVRPTYEAMVRAIWTHKGAADDWVERFFMPRREVVESDAETRMGPNVDSMLDVIAKHHPAHIYQPLTALKDATWRAMHSYVHGGIRPVIQSFVPFPHHEAGSLLINANGMLCLATEVVRMAHGLGSPQLLVLQRQYAECLPLGEALS